MWPRRLKARLKSCSFLKVEFLKNIFVTLKKYPSPIVILLMNIMMQTAAGLGIVAVLSAGVLSGYQKGNVLGAATGSVRQANLHQLTLAVEMYCLDHGAYPPASTGRELVDILYREGYIKNHPVSPDDFCYKVLEKGDGYSLIVANQKSF